MKILDRIQQTCLRAVWARTAAPIAHTCRATVFPLFNSTPRSLSLLRINMFLQWDRRAGETCWKTRGAFQETNDKSWFPGIDMPEISRKYSRSHLSVDWDRWLTRRWIISIDGYNTTPHSTAYTPLPLRVALSCEPRLRPRLLTVRNETALSLFLPAYDRWKGVLYVQKHWTDQM